MNGDLIFQSSLSSQSQAVCLATHSKYSHMGIIIFIDGKAEVFEAAGPVKITPLDKWIKRGEGGKYVVKRLKNRDKILTQEKLAAMKAVGKNYMGRPYDIYFEWSDKNIYCSELVWKIYKKATGLAIGKLQTIKDMDLSHPAVKQKMRERWGETLPLNEPVITPAAMFASVLLETVKYN